jgi:hypothetical protein
VTAESSLDQPGKPLDGKLLRSDGTWSPFQIAQTKRQNCAEAANQAGGLDKVTDVDLANWDLTRSDYNEFRMDHAEALQLIELHRRFDELMLTEFSGRPDRDEYIRVLKLLMPNDWQEHLPPE